MSHWWSSRSRLGEIVDKLIGAFKATVSWVKKRDAAQGLLRRVDAAKERLTRSGSSCSIGNSFVPGTLVLMADGSRVPIEEVELGDRVLATDPVTGESAPREVVATIVGQGEKDLVEIEVSNGGPFGESLGSVIATDEHPFWVPSLGEWVPAAELQRGDWLRTGSGTWVQVSRTDAWSAPQRVHNLTINGIHTYHVLAGTTPVLVHNNGGEPVTDDFNQARNRALGWLVPRGFKAEKVKLGRFRQIEGKPVGMQTANNKVGFRIEFDERSGAHINVWAGKEKGSHFQFNATEATVAKLQRLHGCG
ncbi:polymorphic toxin-type HINT domain-containing protein [Saccharomonospora azurea]|uniref:polymorphic toxin-type HINT domain-containing protein n=1 Tax=Saccharomonospora azurea TaxID=40988 RepID=UPI003D932A3A